MQSVHWEDRGDTRWIALRGDLDNAGYQRVSAKFLETVRGAQRIVVDLSGVMFVSSNGVRLLLAAQQQIRPRGGSIAVTGIQPSVRRVFQTVRIFDAIPEWVGDTDQESEDSDAAALS